MRRVIWGPILAVLVPALGFSQTAKDSWDNLRELQPGQKIQVVDMNLKSLKGRFLAVSAEQITLRTKKGEITIERENVFRVTDRGRSKRLRNVLIGAAIGAGLGLGFGASVDAQATEEGEHLGKGFGLMIGGGAGAGLGAGFTRHRTIYRTKRRQ